MSECDLACCEKHVPKRAVTTAPLSIRNIHLQPTPIPIRCHPPQSQTICRVRHVPKRAVTTAPLSIRNIHLQPTPIPIRCYPPQAHPWEPGGEGWVLLCCAQSRLPPLLGVVKWRWTISLPHMAGGRIDPHKKGPALGCLLRRACIKRERLQPLLDCM